MAEFSQIFFKQTNEVYLFRQRVHFISLLVILCSIGLFVRLAYLQIFHYTFYSQLAQQNYEGFSLLNPARGLIFDRYGVLLADNKPQNSLVLFPSQVSSIPLTLQKLKSILQIEVDLKKFPKYSRRPFESIVLKQYLTEEEVARFEINRYDFPGVNIHTQWLRYYPFNEALASVLGYVGRIMPQERYVKKFSYGVNDNIGKAGIEQFYEDKLRGIQGYQQVEKNAHKRILRAIKSDLPVNGDHLYLTIDANLQKTIQKILGKQVGAVVAMNPRNGEILAFVNNPTFNPNNLSQTLYKKNRNRFLATSSSFYNRTLQGAYPPGSILKPFLSVGALNEKIIRPLDAIYDTGRFQLNPTGRVYRNIYHIAWGNTDLRKAIAVSSDIYFYQLSLKLGIDRMADILGKFGYGKITGIDLLGEGSGLLPTRDWKEKIYGENWYLGDTLNVSIGQGFMSATPLQMAMATSALAMSGKRWKPHILLGWRSSKGKMNIVTPQPLEDVHGLESTWKFIHNAMEAVVLEGSAKNAFKDAPYKVAAKTGTAQVFSLKPEQAYDAETIASNLRDHSLFIAFAPIEKPEIVLSIVLENSTISAGYIARKILDFYFREQINDLT